jgi:hypothetical protein
VQDDHSVLMVAGIGERSADPSVGVGPVTRDAVPQDAGVLSRDEVIDRRTAGFRQVPRGQSAGMGSGAGDPVGSGEWHACHRRRFDREGDEVFGFEVAQV